MKTRFLVTLVVLASALLFSAAKANASTEVWCAFGVRYLAAAHPSAPADDVYDLTFENRSVAVVTHVKLDVMDDRRIYEMDVPIHNPVEKGDMKLYDPIAVHFANPVTVRAAWITAIGDDNGHSATCYPVAINARTSDDTEGRKRVTELRTAARHSDVQSGGGMPFITPDGCKNHFVDATAPAPITPAFPSMAREQLVGSTTVLVRVDIAQTGELIDAAIMQSSGSIDIDRAAITAAAQTKYTPKKVNCIPFASTYTFRATFSGNI